MGAEHQSAKMFFIECINFCEKKLKDFCRPHTTLLVMQCLIKHFCFSVKWQKQEHMKTDIADFNHVTVPNLGLKCLL